MTRIGLISDMHGWLDPSVLKHFDNCNEIWHGGDFGPAEVANGLAALKPLRGVYGNIDGLDIRSRFSETLSFTCEEVNVLIQHIGGYPNRYAPGVKEKIVANQSQLFISGHSHILKVMYDAKLQCLHMNPGAAGRHGWHTMRTLIRFVIDGKQIKDCEVIELGKKSSA